MGSSIETAKRLADLASTQAGFFTATQAVDAGYVDSVHGYHLGNGDWEKSYRGIYRLKEHPLPARPELVIWSLWSRDRDGAPQAVYSHTTALEIHGLLPRQPEPMHVIVPKKFRKNCEMPPELVLHKDDLEPEEIEQRAGFAVTSLERTVRDLETDPKLVFALDAVRHNLPRDVQWIKPFTAETRTFDDVINAGED
jgi:predicted transcriptional regulator of viral defense system